MDPASAIAIATTSLAVIRKGFALSKDVHSMAGDIGKFMDSIEAINNSHKEQKKSNKYGSVGEEALQTFAAKKKAEKMEAELRNFLIANYGMNAWQDVLRIQAQIRKQRLAEKEEKAKRNKLLIEITIAFICLAIGLYGLTSFAIYLKS